MPRHRYRGHVIRSRRVRHATKRTRHVIRQPLQSKTTPPSVAGSLTGTTERVQGPAIQDPFQSPFAVCAYSATATKCTMLGAVCIARAGAATPFVATVRRACNTTATAMATVRRARRSESAAETCKFGPNADAAPAAGPARGRADGGRCRPTSTSRSKPDHARDDNDRGKSTAL